MVLVLAGVFIFGLSAMAHAAADSIDLTVTARIPAPIPTDPAVITNPLDGFVSNQSNLTVDGTCPVITPNVVVAIIDNGTMAGSAPCDDAHEFSVSITLDPGTNALIARVYTITYDPGHDSDTVTVTYNTSSGGSITPPGNGGTPTGSGSASGSGSSGTGSRSESSGGGSGNNSGGTGSNSMTYTSPGTPGNGSGGSATLGITINTPFVVFGPDLPAKWQGSIFGGTLPYRVKVDWGDEGVSNYTVTKSGSLTFSHKYADMESHIITIYVTDSDGQSLTRQYAAVTPYVRPVVGGGNTLTPGSGTAIGGFPGGYSLVGLYGAYLVTIAAFGALWVRGHHQFAYARNPARRIPGTNHRARRKHA